MLHTKTQPKYISNRTWHLSVKTTRKGGSEWSTHWNSDKEVEINRVGILFFLLLKMEYDNRTLHLLNYINFTDNVLFVWFNQKRKKKMKTETKERVHDTQMIWTENILEITQRSKQNKIKIFSNSRSRCERKWYKLDIPYPVQ